MRTTGIAMVVLALLAACGGGGNGGGGSLGPGGPPPGGTLAYTGSFHPVNHTGSGTAAVYVTGASQELRFGRDFVTQAGPRLEVWLVAADDPSDNATVLASSSISLGALESTTGVQRYAIPPGTDLAVYRAVTVWCVAAQVNFTTAPLTMP